eukprot:14649376-Alexandrium_andersonii.AAC.1
MTSRYSDSAMPASHAALTTPADLLQGLGRPSALQARPNQSEEVVRVGARRQVSRAFGRPGQRGGDARLAQRARLIGCLEAAGWLGRHGRRRPTGRRLLRAATTTCG